ncbi:uncharacterized protein LOC141572070 isoform X2 [Rhinolophus sinicus]|uniref:uncharacterized protein LOC141572070 isoform X2 n=1 Tax=Rhinolophus sinicus TaxID=89399 RepID=UPI003D79B0BB
MSRTARPAGLRGDRARSGRLAPPDPAARLPRPEPRSLSSKRTSARWPTRPAPARRVLKVGRPFHKVKGHPPSQKRPTLDASPTLLPRGARERLDSGVFQGPERHPHAPEAPSPPESAAGPEDLRAEAVPSREDASALSAQHREAPRRHLGGPATHRSEGPRNDSQCATSARIGGDAWASA